MANDREPHWHRVLEHVSKYPREQLEFSAPWELTQDGISDAVGITRAHVALVLKNLVARGQVESYLAHVRGCGRRRKVYRVTHSGYRVTRGKYF